MTGIDPVYENLGAIARKLLELGVRQRVILHMSDLGLCADRNGITKKEATVLVDKVNSERSAYYSHYSGSDSWSHPENYESNIDSQVLRTLRL